MTYMYMYIYYNSAQVEDIPFYKKSFGYLKCTKLLAILLIISS